MTLPTLRTAVLLALAAWLSFAVAASLHVQNAFWAAMPVWVLVQASRGLVLERAAFRVIGTLIGAGAGFLLLQLPGPALVHLVVLALWIAFSAGLTHVLIGVQGYAATVAGMTAAIVVIPSVLTSAASMDLAMARVECTLIGVIVGTLVLALLTPVSPLAEFYAQVRSVSADAVAYAARVLRGGAVAHADRSEERRILSTISQLESTARLTSAGSVEGYRRRGDVDLLVVGALSVMAAAQAASSINEASKRDMLMRLDALGARLRSATGTVARVNDRIEASEDRADSRLRAAIGQILDADTALQSKPVAVAQAGASPSSWLAPHREWTLAFHTGAMTGLVSLLAAVPGLVWPAPPVQLLALGVSIFLTLLGSLPAPQQIAPKMLAGVIAGVAAALVYRLAVQPTIYTTEDLLLSVAPFLLIGGIARASLRFGVAAISANMCFLLTSQAGMPASASFQVIFADSMALVLSAAIVACCFLLLPRRAPWQAADAARVIRHDLLRIVEPSADAHPGELQARLARQILRLTLHLGRAPELANRWPAGMLSVLNLGHAMIDLRQQKIPEQVRIGLIACLRQEASPAETVQALSALAHVDDNGPLCSVLAELNRTLLGAAELLSFERLETSSKQR